MYSLKSLFWCFIFIVSLTPELPGQRNSVGAKELLEISSHVYRKIHRPGTRQIVSFEADGSLIRQWSQSADRIFEGRLPFFLSKQTQLELELSDDQQDRFQKVIRKWEQSLQKNTQSFKNVDENKEESKTLLEIKEDIEFLASEKETEILEILSRRQRMRLGQLRLRFLMRTYGIAVVLNHGKILQLLQASERDMAALTSRWKQRNKLIDQKAAEAQKEAIEIAFAPLSPKQRTSLFKEWGFLKNEKKPQIDRLRIQLQFYNEFESLRNFENPFCKIDRFPVYEVDFSGLLKPEELTFEIDPKDEDHISARLIFQLLESGDLASLELSNNQKILLQQCSRDFRQANMMAHHIVMGKKPKTELEKKLSQLQFQSIRRTGGEKAMQGINEILLPIQRKELKSVPLKALAKQYGPAFDLLNGPLGEKIELTREQKRSLKHSFSKAVKKLNERSIEMEEFWIQESIRLLGKTTQKALTRLLGPKLIETPPILSNYTQRNQLAPK